MASAERAHSDSTEFPVVGVGASAGGINALQVLFRHMPAEPNLALVIVQHLQPDKPSQLPALIGKWTTLPVREARSGLKVERNCVYVAPPDQALALEGGVFATRPVDRLGPRAGIDTIDFFFESLAADLGRRAVAVVLSGTGTDGGAGAVRIRQAGGMVLVQDPTTAMHDGMPRAAIAHGGADHVMPVAPLAQELIACASPNYARPASATVWADDVTEALDGIVDLVRTRAGFDLTGYKTMPVLWRIQRRMEARRVPAFRDYKALLQDDPAELESLIRTIPIHVTEFFRDVPVWEALQRDVVPHLFEEAGDRPIRAWTPACATGEEAYSLAMLLAERAGIMEKPVEFQVFATDAAAEMVARASRGIFKPAALDALSPERRQRFFYAADGAFRVKRSLRQKMVFAPQDLLADPPFTGVDLVTCRNLLIYLEPAAIERVLYLLHSSLRPGGYLLLGKNESVSPAQRGFEQMAPGVRIYRKVDEISNADIEFPKRPVRVRAPGSSRGAIDAYAHETTVETHDLPAVLVDERFQILRLYGDTAPFLRFRPGQPTLDLPGLLAPAIGRPFETAAQEALAQGRTVTVEGLPDPSTAAFTLGMRMTALDTSREGGSRLLVSFMRRASTGDESDAALLLADGPPPGGTMDWMEALRLSHEELEASREELQAVNQELRASNDQLNLAIDNLATANAQLRGKIEELEIQSNVLSSGAVMTLFLDQDLRVRWFTPAVSALFPLKSTDAGRLITDLAPRFADPEFLPDVHGVMSAGKPREGEIRSADGRWFLKRIRPFRPDRSDGGSAGVAITFTDITERKRVEEALQQSEQTLRRNQVWLAAQKEAFQSAMDGAPLETSLGILIQTAVEQAESERRCAFYIADRDGHALHHVAGMPDSYARCVDGFRISPESLACGLAVALGKPVITPDVLEEPRWEPWTWLARDYDYRGCWSFPVETSAGKLVGSFAMYFREPREPTPSDRLLAAALTQAAGIIIFRHQQSEERARLARELSQERH